MKLSTIRIRKSVSKINFNRLQKIVYASLTIIAVFMSLGTRAQVSTSSSLYHTIQKQDSLLFDVGFNTFLSHDLPAEADYILYIYMRVSPLNKQIAYFLS